ncbi:CLUMA_CG010924, isoform A [Clunio marinus]|uniref:CLUMA_CG010924, isoform A n=1 Tax=Clunio marinus TaxID=568069 RepID=A0A1J1IBC7_9DIPT|nr:CLUMA_CG010924, isoform A [Clunio marinus]
MLIKISTMLSQVTYEENLNSNPFFTKLMESHNALVNEVGSSNWTILIPRRAQITDECLKSNEFLLSHVLLPSEDLPRTHFTNLLGMDVTIIDNFVRIKEKDQTISSLILFEEIFYTKELQKFKILCINIPLCLKFIQNVSNSKELVKNLSEAIELLQQNTSAKNEKRKIDNAISNFTLRIQKASDYVKLTANIKLLYDYCVNLMTNKRNKNFDPYTAMNLKIALEYYLMDCVYNKIFDAISIHYSEESQKFNKILRKLNEISIEDLRNIKEPSSKINENLNIMKIELLKIDSCKTSVDKLHCFKNVMDAVSLCSNSKLLTTDEMLPILVYAIVKTKYFHWIPTLIFIKEFNLSQILGAENQSAGSMIFYVLTTLEAVIYFLQTNEQLYITQNQFVTSKKIDEIQSQDDYVQYLFQYVKENNEIQLTQLMKVSFESFQSRREGTTATDHSSCHPLCSCSECKHINKDEHSNVNIKSQNGLTMLHIAAAYNVPKMTTLLINLNADVNSANLNLWTPIHYAAYYGHQKVLFLLLHGKSNINEMTKDQQTPLILAALNGHDCCVKALLYFSDHTNLPLNLNAQDYEGNTALHYASQLGFDAIVDGLLEYKAKSTVKNHIGKTPSDYAFNSIIKNKLESAAKYQVDEQDFVFISNEDLADNIEFIT